MRRMRQLACLLTLGVSVGAALAVAPAASAWTVTMTAEPKLKRTYGWTIQKSVDRPAVTIEAGKTTDVTYTVTVGGTGSVDSDWSVGGTVEMSEDPKIGIDWMRVTINPEGTLATLDCLPSTFPVELGVAGLKCLYSAPLPNPTGTRDAWMRAQTTAGNFRNVHTPFDFSAATVDEVDECVQVTDSMAGALGTVCAADAPKTFTYTKTVGPYPTSQCGSQTLVNTASFVAPDWGATAAATANVAVAVTCPPPPPPPPPPSTPSCKDDRKGQDRDKGDHRGDKDGRDEGKGRGHDKDRDDDRRGGRDKGRDEDRGRGRR